MSSSSPLTCVSWPSAWRRSVCSCARAASRVVSRGVGSAGVGVDVDVCVCDSDDDVDDDVCASGLCDWFSRFWLDPCLRTPSIEVKRLTEELLAVVQLTSLLMMMMLLLLPLGLVEVDALFVAGSPLPSCVPLALSLLTSCDARSRRSSSS